MNLSPLPRETYRVGLPRAGAWREALNTDSELYGGSNVGSPAQGPDKAPARPPPHQ